MKQVFVSSTALLRERWREAFADAAVLGSVAQAAALTREAPAVLWLDCSNVAGEEKSAQIHAAVALAAPLVVMTPTPSEADAFAALNAGAMGYCHVTAAASQLREIAVVVAHGGLWMVPELVQRLLQLSRRVVSPEQQLQPVLHTLTCRELMVAQQVARGACNREIANSLEITERTVKAHLSVVFEKLKVRDRVQLALAMNNLPIPTSVN